MPQSDLRERFVVMCHRHEAELGHSTMAPSDARSIVRRMCNELHVDDLTDTATLLTSELVTNAVVHAAGPMRLAVAYTKGQLVVSVSDAEPAPPLPRRARAAELGGRGLTLVEILAEDWGYHSLPEDGKAVWFALRPRHAPRFEGGCECVGESPESAGATQSAAKRSTAPTIPASRTSR